MSQFPTQAVRMINDMPSQFPSQSQSLRSMSNKNVNTGVDNHRTRSRTSSINSKKARLVEEPDRYNRVPSAVNSGSHVSDLNFSEDNKLKDAREVTHAGPDVATAIEDLLEQTSKVKMLIC